MSAPTCCAVWIKPADCAALISAAIWNIEWTVARVTGWSGMVALLLGGESDS